MPPKNALFSGPARLLDRPANLGGGFHLLRVSAPEIAAAARPGSFAMIGLEGPGAPFLSRPLAIFGADTSSGAVEFLVRPLPHGRLAPLLVELPAGASVRLVGPLGRPWRPVEAELAILVAGGTGYAALRLLRLELARRGQAVRVIWGESCASRFPCGEFLGQCGPGLVCATEDGSCGSRGTSVDCLREMLAAELRGDPRARVALYGAGPVGMLRALAALARERALRCQVSLEARMACGFGACRACVVNAVSPHPETGLRRRAVCSDGPVFDAAEIDWDDLQ